MYVVEAINYTYPINETFLLTLDNITTPRVVVKPGIKIEEYNQSYECGCVFDLIMNLNNSLNGFNNYCIESADISVPYIKYGTSYECRLKKPHE